MPTNNRPQQTAEDADLRAGMLKRGRQLLIQNLIIAAALFLPAGTFRWPNAWAYLAVNVIGIIINVLILLRVNPEIIAERAEVRKETKGWDRKLTTVGLFISLAMYIVAGLDWRLGWSPDVPFWLWLPGMVLFILGSALSSWAMISNPYFAPTVSIQEDRGHTAVTGGPYRYVRHPGYCGWIISNLAAPLFLAAYWATIPAVLIAAGFVVRTALEDRTLSAELGGYQAYAGRVRYRLVPGVW
ncbi:MAG: isoprenylcysteine carboxylmethyltransferase family protein [Chloroflexota bacterium]|jgi:protein-S-isoprenylcysteine O-methyltransferase Ste14